MNADVTNTLKNEFAKARETPDTSTTHRERGGCLTVFLVLIIAGAAYYLFDTVSKLSNTNSLLYAPSLMPLVVGSLVANAAILVFALAMWNWKKWGYYGLIVLNIVLAGIMLMLGNVFAVIFAALEIGIINSVYTGRIEMFE